MHHILGNKVLEYDVDDRGVIVDEREIDRTVNHKPNIADWVKEHMVFWYDMAKPVDVYIPGVTYANPFVNLGGKITYDKTVNRIEITAKVTNILGIVWTENGVGDSHSVAVGETLTRPAFTITVEGMPDDLKWGMYESGVADKGNGTFEIPAYTYTNNTETVKTKFIGLTFSQDTFDNVDIKFTFQPLYPNALVTDGVDDYGQVQNLQQGVKMLFYTCNNFRLGQQLYDQRKVGYDNVTSSYFSIFAESNSIAYNARNVDGSTYIDGVLNETIIADNLLEKKTTITIVNGSADSEKNRYTVFLFVI